MAMSNTQTLSEADHETKVTLAALKHAIKYCNVQINLAIDEQDAETWRRRQRIYVTQHQSIYRAWIIKNADKKPAQPR